MTICLLGSIDWFRFATIASFLVEHLREIDDEFGDDEKGPVFLANLVEARHERVNEVFGRTSKPNPVSDESETRHYDIREVRIDLHSSDIDSLLPENLSRALVINYLKSASLVLSGRGQLTDQRNPSAKRIPIGFRSDGEWLWSLEAARYIERDGMPLPPDLLARIVELKTPPELSEDHREEIFAFIKSKPKLD